MTAEEYLAKHSLSPDFVKSSLNWSWDGRVIAIPIFNQSGIKLYDKLRHLDFEERKAAGDKDAKKFTFNPPGTHPTLYGLHKISTATRLVLCEGEPDYARLWQDGIPAVTSTGGVAKFDEAMAQSLAGKEIFICLDTDSAGMDHIMPTARLLVSQGVSVRIVTLPPTVKDACDFFTTTVNPKQEYLALLSSALLPGEWWKLHKPEEFATMTAEELLKIEFPKNPWLIKHILPKEGFAFFVAAEATYKTFLTLDLALTLAEGKNWLGQEQFLVERPARTLFIDKENPMAMIQQRIKGLGYSGEAIKSIRWVKYPDKLSIVDSSGETSEFMLSLATEVVEDAIDLIVIDSFVDLMVGSENSAEETQLFMGRMKEIFPHVCIVALHHENKPSQGVFRNDSQRTRGSTNINAQAQTMFRIEAVAKSRTEITIKQTKCRDLQKLDKFLLQAKVKRDVLGETFVTGFDYMGMVLDNDDKIAEAQETIEEMFKSSTILSKKEIVDACSSQSTAERAIKNLISEKLIDTIKDPNDKRSVNYFWGEAVKTGGDF